MKHSGRGGDFLCAAAVAGGFSFSVLAFCRLFWVLSCLLCSTSLPRGNQVDGLPRAVNDMKNKDFDETCQVCCLLIFVFQLA